MKNQKITTVNVSEIVNQKYYPEFRNKKFKSKTTFEKWLDKKGRYAIHFKDKGQDCMSWIIDSGGEVLHSELQSFVWNGMVVDLSKLKVGKKISVLDSDKNFGKGNIVYDFVVKSINKYE